MSSKQQMGRSIVAAAVTLAVAAACGSGSASGGGKKSTKVAVVVLTSQHPFYQAYANHWRALAKQHNLDLTVLDSQSKVESQQKNVDDALGKQVKGIVLSPVDAASGEAAVKQAAGQGAKVVTVAVQTKSAPVVIEGAYQAGFQGGVAAATWITKNRKSWKVRLGIVDEPRLQQTIDRANGFVAGVQSVIKDARVAARQTGEGLIDKSTAAAENMLQAHPEANLWYGINDDSALGALNALKAAGRGTTKTELVVGFDGSAGTLKELLKPDSALKVEIGNLPRGYAETGLRVLQDALAGKNVPQVNPVSVRVLTDQTPAAEVREYYKDEYGGTF
jgi:ABC-type sugar transport system substrate-binding protein